MFHRSPSAERQLASLFQIRPGFSDAVSHIHRLLGDILTMFGVHRQEIRPP